MNEEFVSEKIINIVLTADKNYVKVIGVTMTSIMENLSKDYKARFYIFSKGFSKDDSDEFLKLTKKYNCEVINYPMENYEKLLYFADDTQFKNKWISVACYFRLLIFKILPDYVDNCFYIDGDMIVNCDLSKIILPDDKLFMSVIEPKAMENRYTILSHCYKMPEFENFTKDSFEYPYFNAGFWLVNLKKAKELCIFDQMMEFLHKNTNPPYADQDTLNAVIGQKYSNLIEFLPPEYNLFANVDYEKSNFKNLPYESSIIDKAIEHPKIIHYAGCLKPWSSLDVECFQDYWWKYSNLSPWKEFFNRRKIKMFFTTNFSGFCKNLFSLENKYAMNKYIKQKIVKIAGFKFSIIQKLKPTDISAIKRSVDKVDCVSFDIFDTLVLRPYMQPEHIFKYIERKYNIQDFAKRRLNAQSVAFTTLDADKEDCSIDDIYDYYAILYKYSDVEKLKEIEKQEEIAQCFRNELIYEIYRYAIEQNKKVIFVSDMYLDYDTVKAILDKNGYTRFDELFLSSVYAKLKSTGSLFDVVLNKIGVKPEKMLHIGDNVISDYKNPKNKKINAIHYRKYQDIYLSNRSFWSGAPYLDSLFISAVIMNNSLHYSKFKSYTKWERFGYEFAGPILYNYTRWINKYTIKNNIQNIIFIARDGFLLKQIYELLYGKDVRTHYVYAPRSLNLCCGLNYDKNGEFTLEHTKNIIDYFRKYSEKIASLPEIKSASMGEKLVEENREELEKLAMDEFEKYKQYLLDEGISSNSIMCVDSVSKYFSAQKLFQRILNKNILGLYYLIQEGADMSNINVESYKDISFYSRDCLMVEYLMTSPESPIDNIRDKKVKYKPISKNEQKRINIFNKISKGVLEFVKDISALPKINEPEFICSSSDMTEFIEAVINIKSKEIKNMYKEAKFATDPKHENYLSLYDCWHIKSHNNFLQNVFSIRNDYSGDIKRKVVTVLGVKFKFKK